MKNNVTKRRDEIIKIATTIFDECIKYHKKEQNKPLKFREDYVESKGKQIFVRIIGSEKEQINVPIYETTEQMRTKVVERATVSLAYSGKNIFPDCYSYKVHGIEFQVSVVDADEKDETQNENALIAIAVIACLSHKSAVKVCNDLLSRKVKLPACLIDGRHYIHNMLMGEPWLHITFSKS